MPCALRRDSSEKAWTFRRSGMRILSMSSPLRIVVLGIVGRDQVAGVTWQALHYLEGFRRLGHEVFYLEDTGDWAPDADEGCTRTVASIARWMDWCGMSQRWAYRAAAADGAVFGVSERRLQEVLERADVLVNVTASTMMRDEHLEVPVRIYLETDPGLPQIAISDGNESVREFLAAHTHHFSFGEKIGEPDCGVPAVPFRFRATRQPIVIDWWSDTNLPEPAGPPAPHAFTTIANWRESSKDVRWQGELLTWSKHAPFLRILDLPRRISTPLELALACDEEDVIRQLESNGWRTLDAIPLSESILTYRDYIRASLGEFTVAKDQYTRLRTGWFSDRSACYLAAGRPVVTQETGFSDVLPTGNGLFAFETPEEAVDALEVISADPAAHGRAALEIARESFCAEKVLARMLRDVTA
jgi:hypothetical protein